MYRHGNIWLYRITMRSHAHVYTVVGRCAHVRHRSHTAGHLALARPCSWSCPAVCVSRLSKTGRRSTELRSPSLTAPRPRRIASTSSLSRERRVTREDESLRHGRLTDSVLFGPMDGVGVCSFSAMHLPTTVCQSLCRSPARNRWTWAFAAASAAARPRWPSHHPKPALLVIIVQVCCLCRELLQGFKDRF